MRFNFSANIKVKKLPPPVQEYLRQRFMLRANYLRKLRCFEHDSIFREAPVKQVRIFSPDLAKQHGLKIGSTSDLEQHPELLLFLGHIDRQGQIYFADRRAPMRQNKV